MKRSTVSQKGIQLLFLLWLIAVAIAIFGVVKIVQGEPLLGVILLVVACLVGPGGYSLFR